MKTIEELKYYIDSEFVKPMDAEWMKGLIDQAVEAERQRIIGVIDAYISNCQSDIDNTAYMAYDIKAQKAILIAIKKEILSTPQPILTPDPNDKLKVEGTQSTLQQGYCEWKWRDDFHCFLTTCEVEFRDNYYDKFPIKMDYWKYCPRCGKPIKVKED